LGEFPTRPDFGRYCDRAFERACDGTGPDDQGTNRGWGASDSSGRRDGAARTKWLLRMPAVRNEQPCASQTEVDWVGQRPKPRCLLLSAVTCFTSPLRFRRQRPRKPENSDIMSPPSGADDPVQRANGTDNVAWEGDSRYDEFRWAVGPRARLSGLRLGLPTLAVQGHI
jgi:hypothetical protein